MILFLSFFLLVKTGFLTFLAICGDGLVLGTEKCDDNNTISNDGCTNCKIDYGYKCFGSNNSICIRMFKSFIHSFIHPLSKLFLAACGDGHTVSGQEECDDGFGKDGTLHPVGIQFGCNNDCTKNVGWNCVNDLINATKSNCTSMFIFLCSNSFLRYNFSSLFRSSDLS